MSAAETPARKPCADADGHAMKVVVEAAYSPCGFCPVIACSKCGCERRECECPAYGLLRRVEIEIAMSQVVEIPVGSTPVAVIARVEILRLPSLVYQMETTAERGPLTLRMAWPGATWREAEGSRPPAAIAFPRRHRFLGMLTDESEAPVAVYYDAVAWARLGSSHANAAAPGVDPQPMKP